jgi:hypothetical protein
MRAPTIPDGITTKAKSEIKVEKFGALRIPIQIAANAPRIMHKA